jgi:hypothetical protein
MRFLSKWSLLLQCSAAGMVRYTKKARRVVFYASEQAIRDMSNEVTPQHLLVGLLRADSRLVSDCRRLTWSAMSLRGLYTNVGQRPVWL